MRATLSGSTSDEEFQLSLRGESWNLGSKRSSSSPSGSHVKCFKLECFTLPSISTDVLVKNVKRPEIVGTRKQYISKQVTQQVCMHILLTKECLRSAFERPRWTELMLFGWIWHVSLQHILQEVTCDPHFGIILLGITISLKDSKTHSNTEFCSGNY